MEILDRHTILSKRGIIENDGDLDIAFLGVGSAFAKKHFQTAILIIKGTTHVLVDFGMDGPRALVALGLGMQDITNFLPTHSHSDHVGGVEALALHNRYVAQRFMSKPKLRCIATPEYQRILWDYTLRGGLEWNEEQPDGRRKLGFGDFFKIHTPTWKTSQPREIHDVYIGDLHLELFRTNHIPEQAPNWEASFVSYGLLIDDRVFYSSDSQFDKELIDIYSAGQSQFETERRPVVEHWFHDVQFFPGAVHAPLADLRTLGTSIKKNMTLMHYSDDYEKHDISEFAGWAKQWATYRFK
jgi:ribonuclease BN (tRNA processing enzyme)